MKTRLGSEPEAAQRGSHEDFQRFEDFRTANRASVAGLSLDASRTLTATVEVCARKEKDVTRLREADQANCSLGRGALGGAVCGLTSGGPAAV